MQHDTLIHETWFRIEAGYNGGHMTSEQHDRFYAEIRGLFAGAGFGIEDDKFGCPYFVLGKTRLYCHPESLSGPTEERHVPLIEQMLARGESFRYECTDKYECLYDFAPEEEMNYYRTICASSIEEALLNAFRTTEPKCFKLRDVILDLLVLRFMVHTVRRPSGTSFDSPCNHYIREVYNDLLRRGLLVETRRKNRAGTILVYCQSNVPTDRT
ncbi:MAG: hypothetical protein NC226_07270 [Bacteroides cellulosilyticus]|nr:hypothetical protein [Bacteroides cellulosilyticus]